MKLYNTLTKQLDELQPLDEQTIRMYSCGPTVYDHIHIGNLSSFIFADTLRRVLLASGFEVKHVMNFTDVDDKTIRRALEAGQDDDPKSALRNVTQKYEALFLEDMMRIGNNSTAITFVRATESIKAMQELITRLHAAAIAYVTDDGVYFSITKYRASGKTYGQLLEITAENTSEARIDNDEYDKDSVHDFALWKLKKDHEPAWEFELNGKKLDGRPGWHIECSAMSSVALGQPFDIHTGGIDLIFPHHENEIAQSTALTENPVMATIFAHNEHLLIDGKKMSKSLQNFYTLEDLAAKGFEPLAFRLLILQAHYRNQTNFTWESLEAAQNRLNSLRAMAELQFQPQVGGTSKKILQNAKADILTALQSDLAMPKAFAILSKLQGELDSGGITPDCQEDLKLFIEWLDTLLGLKLGDTQDITEAQKQLVAEREAARADKDWATSDTLRDQLAKEGVNVKDTPGGTIWTRVTG
jgi:cysteinyl-tRNA synthetase